MHQTSELHVGARIEPTLRVRGRSRLNVRTAGRVTPYVLIPISVAPPGFLTERADQIPGASFSGNPKIYDVVFTTPYPTNNYSIAIECSDGRLWVPQNILNTGFRINSQANAPFTGMVGWLTKYEGESE